MEDRMLPIPNLSPKPTLTLPGAPALIESTRHNFSPIIHGATLTVDRFGRPNNAYAFDGVDDYIQVPDNPSLSLSREYSLILIFKTTDYPSNASGRDYGNGTILTMHLLEKSESYRVTLLQVVNRSPYQPYVRYWHGNGGLPLFNTLIYPNQYYLLAFTYANRSLHVVLNGEIKEQIPNIDEPVASTGPLILGNCAQPELIDSSTKFFKGVIDQVQIFDWALSDAEITKLYASGVL
jgi:hypothetical protein